MRSRGPGRWPCPASPGRCPPSRPGGRREVPVKHEDIPGFMPAMTMAYSVKERVALDGLGMGDLVTATLVLHPRSGDLYLINLKRTGHADLPADARAVKIMDVMN